jgi:hypothetical protein
MSQELREMYANIPAVVRGLFHHAERGLAAEGRLRELGISPRDVEVIPITKEEVRKRSRPILEVLRIRRAKHQEVQKLQFTPGEVVVIVRLHEWTRDKAETALKEMGADEVAYFPPPGEDTSVAVKVAAARIA